MADVLIPWADGKTFFQLVKHKTEKERKRERENVKKKQQQNFEVVV